MTEKKLDEIRIQCPECGGMLERKDPLIEGLWKCPKCKRLYGEAEIRERCAL